MPGRAGDLGTDAGAPPARPGRDEVRAVNESMVERVLAGPPQPLADGSYALRVLESRGRRSGRARRTPLGVVALDGRHYLVSPDPGRDWVANLDATPACRLLAGSCSEERTARRVTGEEAAAAVSSYLRAVRVPWALSAFPVGPEASLAEIREQGDRIAVLRLDPAVEDDGSTGGLPGRAGWALRTEVPPTRAR